VFVFLHRVIGLGVSVEVASQDLHRIWQPDPVWATFIARMLDEHGIRHV
jgi:hypothetical protein